MSRIQYTVAILFVFIAVNKIYCASLITEKDIYNVTQGDLQIRDNSATGNSSLKARSRTKRWIEEYPDTETTSSESFEKNETGSLYYSDPVSTADFLKFIRRPQAHREHGPYARSYNGHHPGGHHDHHPGGHNGLHLTKVRMPTGKMAKISVPNQLRHWKRGRETLLINLDPNGTTGYDAEFDLVANVVRSTKIHKHFSDYDFMKENCESYNKHVLERNILHKIIYNIVFEIEKIVNGGFWTKYRNTQKYIHDEVGFVNERMLFHGTSKAEDILKNGFDERHTKIPGNMFGAGLYFAEHSSKSNGYSFGNGKGCAVHKDVNCDKCERQMMLCRVALGKMQKETFAKLIAHPDPGYNSVKGVVSPGGLKYPEYIVYKGEQVYPEYLITYKIVI